MQGRSVSKRMTESHQIRPFFLPSPLTAGRRYCQRLASPQRSGS